MYRSITLLSILALFLAACVRSMSAFPTFLPPAVPTLAASQTQHSQEAEIAPQVMPTLTPLLSAATAEPAVTQISTHSPSPTSEGASPTPEAAPTAQPFTPDYAVQAGTPITATNFLHLEEGCSWAGLSGQVFGGDGIPVIGLVIEVSGAVDGREVRALGMTGAAANLGAGGYEVKIQGSPVQIGGDLQAQVVKEGLPLSEPTSFSLSPGCANNLVLLNFVAAGALPGAGLGEERLFIPSVVNGAAGAP